MLPDYTATKAALLSGEITLHYQPIVGLKDRQLLGYEALARWGTMPPPGIAAIIEGHNLELTWIRQQLAEVDLLLTKLPAPIWVSLNLSQPVMAIESLPALLQTTPHALRIHLEILESVRLTVAAAAALQQLGAYHIIKADDIGSLDHGFLDRLVGRYSYLFHGIKLCRGLTENILLEKRTATFCELFIKVAIECGLSTTAEWVQSEAQAEQLAEWGCEAGQGSLFGMPEPLC